MRYTLLSDPDACPTWPLTPSYVHGIPDGRWPGTQAGLPAFESHTSAHQQEPFPLPIPAEDHYALVPQDITDLRLNVRTRVPDVTAGTHNATLFIRYNATLDSYDLQRNGVTLTHHKDISVIAALLRGERYEPGYLDRLLDPTDNAATSLLSVDARERQRRTDAATRARARLAAEEAETARLRRNVLLGSRPPPPDLDLSDLL